MHDGLATLTMISRDLLQSAIQYDYFSVRKHAFILVMNTSHHLAKDPAVWSLPDKKYSNAIIRVQYVSTYSTKLEKQGLKNLDLGSVGRSAYQKKLYCFKPLIV